MYKLLTTAQCNSSLSPGMSKLKKPSVAGTSAVQLGHRSSCCWQFTQPRYRLQWGQNEKSSGGWRQKRHLNTLRTFSLSSLCGPTTTCWWISCIILPIIGPLLSSPLSNDLGIVGPRSKSSSTSWSLLINCLYISLLVRFRNFPTTAYTRQDSSSSSSSSESTST